MGAPDKAHSKYPHVYAIVRFDPSLGGEHAATVVKVIPSKDLAEREAARLNALNHEVECFYRVQTTRFVENPES